MESDRTILLADDDPLIRKSLADLLEQNGYRVLPAEDGAAAWSILEKPDAPEVILLDWMMPGLSGLDVVDRIRAEPRLANTFVIFLTVKNTAGDIITSLNRGAQDFIVKPFDPEELLARIRVAFRTVDLQRELAARVKELEEALRRITQLEGILPICSRCKKIRDSRNEWSTVESYISHHAPVSFSHGYCPECYQKALEEIEELKPA